MSDGLTSWLRDFGEYVTAFVVERTIVAATVRITFRDGSHCFVSRMAAGPGGLLSIDPFPDDPPRQMVEAAGDGLPVTATRMLVPFDTIERIELLAHAPGREVGFRVETGEKAGDTPLS